MVLHVTARKLICADIEVAIVVTGRFANESFRQLSVRQRLRSIRQRSSTFLCQFANATFNHGL